MGRVPSLGRDLLRSPHFAARSHVSVSPDALLHSPEKALQFGTGAFLRGFVEYFLDQSNRDGTFGGRVVVVESTGNGRAQLLNEQDGLYTLSIQGLQSGAPRVNHQVISCVSRALSATDDWDAVLACARNPELELVFSNTTEVGIALDEEDEFDMHPPQSFPGKLTRFLYERGSAFAFDAAAGLVVLPCELIEDNGDRLREIVAALAVRWELGGEFINWLDCSVVFCNTLVDRIVSGAPIGEQARALGEMLGYRDEMLTVCEPYGLFAIEGEDELRERLAFSTQPGVLVAQDISPYRVRKVRLLNGTHTISVSVALLCGCETVREALDHDTVGAFIRTALMDEIVPSVDAPGADTFAREVLDRFANPYIHHALVDITLQGTMKMRVRVVPSILGFVRRQGHVPRSLSFGFAAHLELVWRRAMKSDGGSQIPPDDQAEHLLSLLNSPDTASDHSVSAAVGRVCSDINLWGIDLALVPGFSDAVAEHLTRIRRAGMLHALEYHMAEAQLCR